LREQEITAGEWCVSACRGAGSGLVRKHETARTQSGKAFEMLKSARAGRADGLGKMSVRLAGLHVMLARWAEDLRKIMARGCGLRAAVRQ
jgi:hypothetical protein